MLKPDRLVVSDDGIGFRNRQEIAAWFEKLGFPHDEGNHRIYGFYGMGRAQMWAYASTVWRSNQFTMSVDVKKRALAYDLQESVSSHAGTEITATFYSPLSSQELVNTKLSLTAMLRYVSVPVLVNGVDITEDPSLEAWDFETPDAWFRFATTSRSLTVYNAGVYVAEFPRWRFNVCGVIVTKPEVALRLNLSRNDIMDKECDTWKRLTRSFPGRAEVDLAKKEARELAAKAKDPAHLRKVASAVLQGSLALEDALREAPHLFVSPSGRPVTYLDLLPYRPSEAAPVVVFGRDEAKPAREAVRMKAVLAVSVESLTRLKLKTAADLKAFLTTHCPFASHYAGISGDVLARRPFYDSVLKACPDLASKNQTLKGLTPEQKALLEPVAKVLGGLLSMVSAAIKEAGVERPWLTHVKLGTSAAHNSWLHGTYWVLTEKAAKQLVASEGGVAMVGLGGVIKEALLPHLGEGPTNAMLLRLAVGTGWLADATIALRRLALWSAVRARLDPSVVTGLAEKLRPYLTAEDLEPVPEVSCPFVEPEDALTVEPTT